VGGVADILKPGGQLIGRVGKSPGVREVVGTADDAQALFNQLARGGNIRPHPKAPGGKLADLPGGGTVGFRASSKSGPPTVDINIPGFDGLKKIKFVPK